MNTRCWAVILGVVGWSGLLALSASAQTEQAPPPPPQGVEVLTKGPVHEAYAAPVDVRPPPGPVVPKQPPDPIQEVPPDQKPEGDNVQWVPGYWSWDTDQNDYLWVSGFWRTPPPGRQWVPGQWQEVEGGWQWSPGFWAPADQQDITYIPAPPPSIDAGPSTPAPDETSTYVPGCWIHRESRFFWRPGFWVAYNPNWLWVPAHYVWCPSGYIFVEGYWDHPLADRGLLFAPIRILERRLLVGWTYTPQYCVQPDFLLASLFVGPHHHHYCFGDYYEDRYQREGFVPWFDYRIGKHSYDPNFSFYRHTFHASPEWERGLHALYEGRRSGEIARPPVTLVQQQKVIHNITVNKTNNVVVNKNINITNVQNVHAVTALTQIHNTHVTNLGSLARVENKTTRVINLQPVKREELAQHQKAIAEIHAVAKERQQHQEKLLLQGPPVKHTDPPHTVKLEARHPAAPAAAPPAQPPVKPATPPPTAPPTAPRQPVKPPPPPPPTAPKHVEAPIPKHEPPPPAKPPMPKK
jgi:hypothetical protein